MGSATLEPEVRGGRSPDLTPGTLVGDYRIDHTIGTGGMGAVYQATQPMIGKRVAIKVLHRSKSSTAINRFVKEARAVNLIGHPNIVDVFGFGMTDDGRAYLVMELLVGETLAARVKRAQISVAETCAVLVEVAHALEAAHEAGIVHRDLKPENIFLTKRKEVSSVKLLDFGIAKLINDGEPGMVDDTRPGVLIGTPRYISPEQVRGKPLDGGSDIYALGVVAFELLAGRPPFTSVDSFELFEKHAKLRPPKPSAFNHALPEQADALVGAMLEKEPSERPTLAEVRAALGTLSSAPASELAAVRAAAAAQPTDVHRIGASTDATTPIHAPKPRRARTWIIAGSLVAVATGAALAIATSGSPEPLPVASPAITAPAPAPIAAPSPAPEAAPAVAEPEPAIEIDPVTHVATPSRAVRTRPAHPKRVPIRSSTDPKPPTPSPPPTTHVDGRDLLPVGSAAEGRRGVIDDDAVRSPFEQKP